MICLGMEVQSHLNIIIAADHTPRSKSIAGLIEDGFRNLRTVKTSITPSMQISDSDNVADVILVDLLSSQYSTVKTLSEIKSNMPDSKLIALHIYKSLELIKPIYELGIDGYLYCDPARGELVRAINTVSNGEKFYPAFLAAEKNA